MKVAALITWLVTAGGGFFLLGTWLARGGMKQQEPRRTRFPAPLIFGHFLLAAVGLVVWIVYVATDTDALAWVAFVLLVPVALLGFTMFFRWLPERTRAGRAGGAPGGEVAAEQRFPVPVVLLHGALAATTLVLVLLAALDV